MENHVIHNNFSNFTIIPITKTEEEICFISPFKKCNVTYTLTQHYFWNEDQVSIKVTVTNRNIAERAFRLA